MIQRVTNLMIHNKVNANISRHAIDMSKTEDNLSSGKKIRKSSDNPAAAANAMHYRSRLTELAQYNRNSEQVYDRLNLTDSHLNSVTDILHRVRYLTVQGANGINTNFEMKEAIGREIDEHLKSLIDLANAKDSTGRPIFAGSTIEKDPFVAVYSRSPADASGPGSSVTGVIYNGDAFSLPREIERGQNIETSIPGSQVFWGTNMTISANTDASGYVALADQEFLLDGVVIKISAGDMLDDIIDKINSAPVEVTAMRGGQNDLILTSDTPHLIAMEDTKGGTVLQDIGLVDAASPRSPNNYSANATVTGQSIFDVLITLRDDLSRGDILSVGGKDLEAIDMAMENVLRYRAQAGARVNRIENHIQKIAMDQVYMQRLLSQNEDIDITEEVMNLKLLESAHQYALRVGASLIRPTLMDFLR